MGNRLVSINLEPVAARILASLPHSSDKERIVAGLGAMAMSHWVKLAKQRLRSTSRDYIAGINHRQEGERAVITLDGKIPNMVEQGMPAHDMRDTLLKGPNVKWGKNGPYNTVPFRHGTPGTGGRNVGAPMPKAIHDVAKKLLPTLGRHGSAVATHGGKTSVFGKRLHPGLPMRTKARQILHEKKQPWHKSSIYMSMIRKGKHVAGGKVQTTGYTTFRRISRNSDPRAWKHPGIKARHIARDVEKHVADIASSVIQRAMGQRG